MCYYLLFGVRTLVDTWRSSMYQQSVLRLDTCFLSLPYDYSKTSLIHHVVAAMCMFGYPKRDISNVRDIIFQSSSFSQKLSGKFVHLTTKRSYSNWWCTSLMMAHIVIPDNGKRFPEYCIETTYFNLDFTLFVTVIENWNLRTWSWRTNGIFTLHDNGTGTGTGNWTSTMGNNGSWSLSMSQTSVNISVQYIRTNYSCPCPLYLFQSCSHAVWTCHNRWSAGGGGVDGLWCFRS